MPAPYLLRRWAQHLDILEKRQRDYKELMAAAEEELRKEAEEEEKKNEETIAVSEGDDAAAKSATTTTTTTTTVATTATSTATHGAAESNTTTTTTTTSATSTPTPTPKPRLPWDGLDVTTVSYNEPKHSQIGTIPIFHLRHSEPAFQPQMPIDPPVRCVSFFFVLLCSFFPESKPARTVRTNDVTWAALLCPFSVILCLLFLVRPCRSPLFALATFLFACPSARLLSWLFPV